MIGDDLMRKTTEFIIPDGYTILSRTKVVELEEGVRRLCTRERHRITEAVRMKDETVRLTQHRIRCPFCGHERPAYSRFHGKRGTPGTERAQIKTWANAPVDSAGILRLNVPLEATGDRFCKRCVSVLLPETQARRVTLIEERKKITVECAVLHPKEAEGIFRLKNHTVPDGVMTAAVVFNLRNGHTFLRVYGESGELLLIHDVTNMDAPLMRDITSLDESDVLPFFLIAKHHLLRRAVLRAFARYWERDFPVSSTEMRLGKRLIELTQFIGYPMSFYDAIPYDVCKPKLAPGFQAIARKLHYAGNVPALYAASSLPEQKALRRVMFERPGLFFYLPEIETFAPLFREPCLFCSFLSGARVHHYLSALHVFPKSIAFYQAFRAAQEEKYFAQMLIKVNPSLVPYSLKYIAMAPIYQKDERFFWRFGSAYFRGAASNRVGGDRFISIPVGSESGIPDSRIYDYSFITIRTRVDFRKAGDALHNCLGTWRAEKGPVVLVCRAGEPTAAILVYNGEYYALGPYDNHIPPNSPDDVMIRRWAKKFGLHAPNNESKEYDPYAWIERLP